MARVTNYARVPLTARLTLAGEPIDEAAAAANVRERGFVSPKDEFTYSNATPAELAKAWDVSLLQMRTWISKYKLVKRRELHDIATTAELYRSEDTQLAREEWSRERCEIADKLIAKAMEILDSGVEAVQTSTGGIEEGPLTTNGLLTLANTISAAAAIKNTALGQPSKITGSFSKVDVSSHKVIESSIVHSPVATPPELQEAEIEPPPLPPLRSPGQMWDAQVLEPADQTKVEQ